ncbi:MAG TPA: PRC-barrel domain-containing protein [Xanthomonadales bacterium]|nr:PRC-barrel domain-containing protein [Xanthomonadales bacterium]
MKTRSSLIFVVVMASAVALGAATAPADGNWPGPQRSEQASKGGAGAAGQNRRDPQSRQDADRRQDAEHRPEGVPDRGARDAEHRQDDGRGQDAQHRQDATRPPFTRDELIGLRVVSRENQRSVGKVSDVIFDEDGNVQSAVIKSRGAFGLFVRKVVVPWRQIEHTAAGREPTLLVDMDRKTLRNAPEYRGR